MTCGNASMAYLEKSNPRSDRASRLLGKQFTALVSGAGVFGREENL
jgi:hypothetical protein